MLFKVDNWGSRDVILKVDSKTVYQYSMVTDNRYPSVCNSDAADNSMNEAIIRIE